jgi:glutathione S-transferase
MSASGFVIWGSELSPFTLKALLLLRYAGLGNRLLPADGRRWENLRAAVKVTAVRRGWLRPTYPVKHALDELPLVPYLLGPKGVVVFDSSAMAEWLDRHGTTAHPKLLPSGGAARFAARIIDEYFDEVGLYLAHHNRWVRSAATNDAGERLANEFRTLVPRFLSKGFARRFAARQVRRLPYLFSIAPAEPERYDVPPNRRPPGRVGFPPTHDLLDSLFQRMLAVVEPVLRVQPFLLGERFSIADASLYGQVAMNMSDPTTAATVQIRAPALARWVQHLRRTVADASTASHDIRPVIMPLLREIGDVFVPLMQQNELAYATALRRGERIFNEAAFERGRAFFDGELCGRPFRTVVKTFQVRVWRALKSEWAELAVEERKAFPFSLE